MSNGGSTFFVHDAIFSLLAATWWMSRWRRRRYGQWRRGGQHLSWWRVANGWRRSESVCVWRRDDNQEESRRVVVWSLVGGAQWGRDNKKIRHVLFCVLVSGTGRGLARFGPRAGLTGQRAWRAGLSWAGGLKFLAWPMLFQSGWQAGPSGLAHFSIPTHRVTRPLKQPRPLILHSLAKINALALPFSLRRSSAMVWVLPFFALTQPHSSIHVSWFSTVPFSFPPLSSWF